MDVTASSLVSGTEHMPPLIPMRIAEEHARAVVDWALGMALLALAVGVALGWLLARRRHGRA